MRIEKTKSVIQAIKEGKDDEALSLLYKNLLPKVRHFILKNNGSMEDVKDVFQDTVVVFYKYVQSGRFDLNADVYGFIFGVSKKLYYKSIQQNQRYTSLSIDLDGETDENILGEIIEKEKSEAIQNLMEELGNRCKELLQFSVFNNLSMKEIAVKMGFNSEDAAKTGNYKCKQRLLKLIKSKPSILELLKGNQ